MLNADNTAIGDKSIDVLRRFTELAQLEIKRTKLTEPGVKKLAAALPGCKIMGDGGTFGPTPGVVPNPFTNSLGMEFARVPRGKSWLGGGNGTEGTNEVDIAQDFYLGVYEVTQEEWQKVMGKNPSRCSARTRRQRRLGMTS